MSLRGLRNASWNSLMRPSTSIVDMRMNMAVSPSAAHSIRTWRVLVEGIGELRCFNAHMYTRKRFPIDHARQEFRADTRQQTVRQDRVNHSTAAFKSCATHGDLADHVFIECERHMMRTRDALRYARELQTYDGSQHGVAEGVIRDRDHAAQ